MFERDTSERHWEAHERARGRWWLRYTWRESCSVRYDQKSLYMWRFWRESHAVKTQHPSQNRGKSKMEETRKISKTQLKEAPLWLLPSNLPISIAFCFLLFSPSGSLFLSPSQSQKIFFVLSVAKQPALLHSALLYEGIKINSNSH